MLEVALHGTLVDDERLSKLESIRKKKRGYAINFVRKEGVQAMVNGAWRW